jgi:uncharacterized protein (DUF697 family)
MARRRSSTIGHDPLQAMGEAKPSPAATPPAEPPPSPVDAAVTTPPPPAVVAALPVVASGREARAFAIVRSYFGWSAAAALLPLPLLDLVAIVGVQVKMLEEVARLYRVPFDRKMVRPLIVALISGTGGWFLAGMAASLVRAIPGGGLVLSILTEPALATASCWATGRVFVLHFESGGTFLDFDPARMRAHYARHFAAAQAGA